MISLDLTFVFQIVNFLVILLVLNVFLYKPIRKVLAERSGTIEGARAKAQAVDREVQEKLALYESRLREVKAAAHQERAALIREAQEQEHALVESARKEAADTLSTITNKVGKEAADARAALKQQAEVLSSEIFEKVLGRSL
ncbi:MAG TPA: ATP synthase F0 subunit B [Verrucomicrobiae bacterium]|nr:ATP synthase F0 subunit B [Verrucomicrobiae bacterium]